MLPSSASVWVEFAGCLIEWPTTQAELGRVAGSRTTPRSTPVSGKRNGPYPWHVLLSLSKINKTTESSADPKLTKQRIWRKEHNEDEEQRR